MDLDLGMVTMTKRYPKSKISHLKWNVENELRSNYIQKYPIQLCSLL